MGRAREPRHEHAQRRLRARRAARFGSDDHARSLPVTRVRFFYAPECHLCERARVVIAEAQADEEFELDEVDISGVPELEARYREWLPVVEIDGQRAFSYFVPPDALRRKLAQARREEETL